MANAGTAALRAKEMRLCAQSLQESPHSDAQSDPLSPHSDLQSESQLLSHTPSEQELRQSDPHRSEHSSPHALPHSLEQREPHSPSLQSLEHSELHSDLHSSPHSDLQSSRQSLPHSEKVSILLSTRAAPAALGAPKRANASWSARRCAVFSDRARSSNSARSRLRFCASSGEPMSHSFRQVGLDRLSGRPPDRKRSDPLVVTLYQPDLFVQRLPR